MKKTKCSAEDGLNRILIVKTSSLGDIIHSFPVVSYLKHKFPKCQIDWLVEAPFSKLPESHPSIERTIKVKTKAWRHSPLSRQTISEWKKFRSLLRQTEYDLIIDLQGNIKSGLLASQARGLVRLGFGIKTASEWPNILFSNRRVNPPAGCNIRDDYLNLVKFHLNDDKPFSDPGVTLKSTKPIDSFLVSGKPNYLVCPGANWINKQLTPETLSKFLTKIQETAGCHFLLAWGNTQEKELAEKLLLPKSRLLPHLPLPSLQNLMSKVDLVIAMDSLPLHLAATTTTPTYSIFGPSNAEKYRPPGSSHRSFQGCCPYGKSFDKRCPILRTCSTGDCIKGIPAEVLSQDFYSFLQNIRAEGQ